MKMMLALILATLPAQAAEKIVAHCSATVVASEYQHVDPPLNSVVSMNIVIVDQQPVYTDLVFRGTGSYTGNTVFGIYPGQDYHRTEFTEKDGIVRGSSCYKEFLVCTKTAELEYDNRAFTGTLVDYVRSCEPQENCPTEKATFSLRCDAAIHFPQ